MGVRGCNVSQRNSDRLKHRVQICQDFVIPKPKDGIPASDKILCALLVIPPRVNRVVMPAVKLNDQSTFKALEIDHEGANRILTSKSVPAELALSQ